MSSTEAAAETKPMAEKPAKEKKARAPKAAPKEKKQQPKSSSKLSAPSHPPYFQMIKEAIQALNERTGSSPYAIAKHMEEEHKGVLPANFRKMLAVQLKNFAAKGKLLKVKASFKLSDLGKKEEKTKKASVVEKKEKPKSKASTGTKRKVTGSGDADSKKKKKKKTSSKGSESKTKKPAVKKMKRATPVKAKAKAKQPKSIKSPVKRARKATA